MDAGEAHYGPKNTAPKRWLLQDVAGCRIGFLNFLSDPIGKNERLDIRNFAPGLIVGNGQSGACLQTGCKLNRVWRA